MIILYYIIVILIICFSGVILFGAPYLPTLSKQRLAALEMLDLKKGQLLFEPGCGDGRVLVLAAKRGIRGVGIELNPIMYLVSRIITFKYRKQVKVIWGNFWHKDWPEADGIFLFLLDKYMKKFDEKIKETQKKPTKVASFAFEMPEKKAIRQKEGVFLYRYN